MNDILAEMVEEDFENQSFEEEDINFIPDEDIPSKIDEDQSKVEGVEETIKLIPLATWFENNHEVLQTSGSVGYLNLNIKGFDPNESLLFTVPHPDGGQTEDGVEKVKLRFFDNSNKVLVPDTKTIEMFHSLNSGFVIYQRHNNDIIVKNYTFKSGLIAIFCCRIDNIDIPFSSVKVKRKDNELIIPRCDKSNILSKLNIPVDKQTLQLLYKQIESSLDKITTVKDAIIWLSERQKHVGDLYHLVQIDDTIIRILK